MNKEQYKKLVKKYTPKENILKNALIAFLSGGVIGLISAIIYVIFLKNDFDVTSATSYTLIILILLSALCTGIGFFDNIVEKYKCGIIIPITGFAHSVTSAAIDSRREGFITGIGASIFKLAGSVLLYGIVSAFLLTIIKVVFYG